MFYTKIKGMIAQEEIRNVEDYLRIIKLYKGRSVDEGNHEDFLFRGQTEDLPLIPKIARLNPIYDSLETERTILEEFKRSNPLLLESYQAFDDWDYLTLGQHYGLPTRLLDWSNNALTALWFATNNFSNESAVVWVLMAGSKDFELETHAVQPFDIKETKIFRPRIIKQRINTQSGVFSVQPSCEIEEKLSLDKADSFKDKLLKIQIRAEDFRDIRRDLDTFGVNDFTIFPELEGLCSYLQWRYFE